MGEAMAVTVITRDGALDALHPDDYREIYDEIRQYDAATNRYGVSLDKFVALVESSYSKTAWWKWHQGELELTRTMRNELRRGVGMPAMNLTIAEAVAGVDENAEVVQVGGETPNRVVLVGTHEAITLHLNGTIEAVTGRNGAEQSLTPHAAGKAVVTKVTNRAERRSVSLPVTAFERTNEVRLAAGLSWEEFLGLACERLGSSDRTG